MNTRYQGEGYIPAANAVHVVIKLPNGMTREVCRFSTNDDFLSNTKVLVMDGQSNMELSSYKGSNGW